MNQLFSQISTAVAYQTGRSITFIVALLLVLIWFATGPLFHYSDTWQLVINTGSSIITFLMVFLIQSTQNRDAKVVHLKLDELIRAVTSARNHLVHLENLSDEELEALEKEFQKLHDRMNKPARQLSGTPSQEGSHSADRLK